MPNIAPPEPHLKGRRRTVVTGRTAGIAGFQAAKDSPLWPQVAAVRTRAVYEVDNRPWYCPTVRAAQRMMADIEAAFLSR